MNEPVLYERYSVVFAANDITWDFYVVDAEMDEPIIATLDEDTAKTIADKLNMIDCY
ncbi:hypothetical protein AB4254_08510 [Vibrio breoganii]